MTFPRVKYRTLSIRDLNQMHSAFVDAYGRYPIQLEMDKEQFFDKFVQRVKMDFHLSVGAFVGESLIGFVLNAVGNYDGRKTAYNASTGVRPAFRGRGLTQGMYRFLIPKFRAEGLCSCALEVLRVNAEAIHVYHSIGFEPKKGYACYRWGGDGLSFPTVSVDYQVKEVKTPQWTLYKTFHDHDLCFLDCPEQVAKNCGVEKVVELHTEGRCTGYAVYQEKTGRIGQVAVDRAFRRKGMGLRLIRHIHEKSYGKVLTAVNVGQGASGVQAFFEALGFRAYLDFIEMRMDF